jgi:Domain of unknown function (DUF5664)
MIKGVEEIAEYVDGKKYILTEVDKASYQQCSQCAFAKGGYECVEDKDGYLLCNTFENHVWKEVKIMNKLDITKQEDTAGALLAAKPKTELAQPKAGTKYDSGKPMYNLIPASALHEVVKVLTIGGLRYNEPINEENWRKVPDLQHRYFAAAQRHIWADKRGLDIDVDDGDSKGTNCYHLACAIASLMFMLQDKIEKEGK